MNKILVKSASRLRIVLWIAFVLLLAIAIAISVLSVNKLNAYAVDVNGAVIEAKNSEDAVTNIKQQAALLEKYKSAVDRAKKVVAERNGYAYQNTIIADIGAIARSADIEILGYTFSDSSSGESGASAATTTPAATATAGADAAATEGASASSQGSSGSATPTQVTISFTNPVGYQQLLDFIHRIEQNVTRMQIERVSISPSSGDEVSSEGLTIEVYTQ